MHYIKLTLLVFSTMLLTACEDNFLDVQNPNQLTVDQFWQSEQNAIDGLMAVYGATTLDGIFGRWIPVAQNYRDDLTRSDSPWGELESMSDFSFTSTSFTPNIIWQHAYHGIFRANQVIANVPDIEMDSELKEQIIGEARFLRAMFYFQLVKNFENIPLITEVQPVDAIEQEQVDPQVIYDFLFQEFQAAQEVLPESFNDQQGRATWGAATAFLGKAYLFDEQWEAADREFKKIIDSGIYSLVEEHNWNFDVEHEHNSESIYEINYTQAGGGTVLRPGNEGEGVVDLTPTSEWMNTQLRPMTFSPAGFGWGDTVPSRALFEDLNSEKTVNGNPDPRMFSTIIWNHPNVNVYGSSYAEVFGPESDAIFWAKYQFNERDLDREPEGSDVNVRVIRYADVLLMYAETRNELGDQATAARYIQMVRDRANMPDREAEFAQLTQQEMRDRIAHERVVELAGESKRWDDIKRWGWLEDPEKMNFLQQRNPDFEGFTDRAKLLPIPQSEMDTNPVIDQNPGF